MPLKRKLKKFVIVLCSLLLEALWPILLLLGQKTVRKLVALVLALTKKGKSGLGQPVIFVAIPRSASKTIALRLSKKLGTHVEMVGLRGGSGYFPFNMLISRGRLLFSVLTGRVAHDHLYCDERTINAVSLLSGQIFVHVRDPRAVLASLTKHVVISRGRLSVFGIEESHIDHTKPLQNYDYMIKTFFPVLLDWVQSWVDCKKADSSQLDVRFLHYENFVNSEEVYFDELLENIGLDRSSNTQATINKHFLGGDSDEWQSNFTDRQLEDMDEMLDDGMAAYFGWPVNKEKHLK